MAGMLDLIDRAASDPASFSTKAPPPPDFSSNVTLTA